MFPHRRIVLFGATGYTGELAARAMVRRGLRPVLAARRPAVLEALSAELGGLETAVADVARPSSLRALVDPETVLVTTVGPMARLGTPVIEAALRTGAHYIDSSGESAFVRRVFETYGPRAQRTGVLLLPATGYDSVPGNLAGALVLARAGARASRVRIGYFVSGARRGGLLGGLAHMSGGSRATFAAMALERGFAWRGGRIVDERGSARVGRFRVDGRWRRGVSFGTSEAFALPRAHPHVDDIDVFFGWFDGASRMLQLGSAALSGLTRVPGVRAGAASVIAAALSRSAGGPRDTDSGSLFVAEAMSAEGEPLARVALEGINGYVFTGEVLAWAAEQVAAGRARGTGTLGPVEAFGLEPLQRGVAESGIREVPWEPCGP